MSVALTINIKNIIIQPPPPKSMNRTNKLWIWAHKKASFLTERGQECHLWCTIHYIVLSVHFLCGLLTRVNIAYWTSGKPLLLNLDNPLAHILSFKAMFIHTLLNYSKQIFFSHIQLIKTTSISNLELLDYNCTCNDKKQKA